MCRRATDFNDEEPLLRHVSEPTHTRPLAGAVAACVATVAMAGYLILGKAHVSGAMGRGEHDAGGFALCRQATGAVLMCIGALARHGRAALRPSPQHYDTIGKLGICNFLNSILFIWGFKLTSPFVASVAQLSIPVITYCWTACTGVETPSCRKGVGVCLVICGSLIVVVGSSATASSSPIASGASLLIGLAALTVQTSSFAGLLVVQKRMLADHPVSLVVAWGYSCSVPFAFLSSLIDGSLYHVLSHFNSRSSIAIVLYSASIGAFLYFELITFATRHLPSTVVACSVALEPLAVSVLSVLVFHASISALETVGYAIALLGVGYMTSLVVANDGEGPGSPRDLGDAKRRLSSLSASCISADDGDVEMLPVDSHVRMSQRPGCRLTNPAQAEGKAIGSAVATRLSPRGPDTMVAIG